MDTPWYFKGEQVSVDTDRNYDATITRTATCGDLDDQCEQEWQIVVNANDLCGNTDADVPVTISYQPEAQDNVQGANWTNPLGRLEVTLTMEQETFICSVELAEGEITASAAMEIFEDASYADNSKTAWRTSETPYFRVSVSTTQALQISATDLVWLDLVQNPDAADEADVKRTRIVDNKAAVAPLTTFGRQNMDATPYTGRAGTATTVEFSVNLDLDLFVPFDNLDAVRIKWEVLVEIFYADLDDGNRRRRLLQVNAPARAPGRATAFKEGWMMPQDRDLDITITLEKSEAARVEDESSSEEEAAAGDSNMVLMVLLGVIAVSFGVAVYVLKMIKDLKTERIQMELRHTRVPQADPSKNMI